MKLLSLFSGIGAFEKALTNIGLDYELVGFSEIDKWAIQSYCAIHNVDEKLNLGDVSKIKNEDLPKDIDMITYGFPCQDVSIAGKQEGLTGGTKSGLLYEAERIIQEIKPKYAIAENVPNLLNNKFKADFDNYINRLAKYGYSTEWRKLNSKNFGIPQDRERVFIISKRADISTEPSLLDNIEYKDLDISVFDLLESEVPDKYNVNMENKNAKYWFDKLEAEKVDCKNILLGGLQKNQSVKTDGLSTTLTASMGMGGGYKPIIFNGNNLMRNLTPLECFRLMGFEDYDYKILTKMGLSDTQLYKQAGNSIVVNVLEEIFKKLLI